MRKCSETFRIFLSLYFVGPKESRKFPRNFPQTSLRKIKKFTDELLQERREKNYFYNCTHTCYTKDLLPNHLCNHFEPHSIRSGKTDPVQFKWVLNRALFAYKKANLSFKSPSPKPHLNRIGSVFALPIVKAVNLHPLHLRGFGLRRVLRSALQKGFQKDS